MDIVRRNQELKRMNRDIRRMQEQIDTLKGALSVRQIERANLIHGMRREAFPAHDQIIYKR